MVPQCRIETASATIMKMESASGIQTGTVSATIVKTPPAPQIRMETVPMTAGRLSRVLRLRQMELMDAGTDGIIRPAAEMERPMDTDMVTDAGKSREQGPYVCLR